jgi:methylmalonyl-CoA/ethylmalonyl-CoA epimerase
MAALDHIGIAVRDKNQLSKLLEIIGISQASTPNHVERVNEQGVDATFITLPAQSSHIELLEAYTPDSTIAKYIDKRGPGIHHLSFRLKKGQLISVSKQLADAGYRLIYPAPKVGAHEMRINFIHPESTGGVLIEIMEPMET